jgi:carbamoyl-phosphate synthase / aspartate carbamoyltransferase / dihydroorotase
MCKELIVNLRKLMDDKPVVKPIFGICLGHQLLAIAAGCSTFKMKYVSLILNIDQIYILFY